MRLINTELEGVFIIENFHRDDDRGSFIKTYNKEFFKKNNLCTNFEESYFSISNKEVIRGMHFQLPPHEHEKLIYVAQGEVIDVILDLRKNSRTFGKHIKVILDDRHQKSIYIPKGLAHGFKANINNTIMVYNVSTIYNKDYDTGIRYDSFGLDWDIINPAISERDKSLVEFNKFKDINPF